jgi:hypothetical protein
MISSSIFQNIIYSSYEFFLRKIVSWRSSITLKFFFHAINKTLREIWSIDQYLVHSSKAPLKTQIYNFSSILLYCVNLSIFHHKECFWVHKVKKMKCIIHILLLSYLDRCLDRKYHSLDSSSYLALACIIIHQLYSHLYYHHSDRSPFHYHHRNIN